MKQEYKLTSGDVVKVFDNKKDFEKAARKIKRSEEQAEERRARSRRQAKFYACQVLVQLALDVDDNNAKNYHFSSAYKHMAPNGFLCCKVPHSYCLNPNPNDKDFASMVGDRYVTDIVFDIMDDAVAFKHFSGSWFTVGVEYGVLEQVPIPKSLADKLDALLKARKPEEVGGRHGWPDAE